VKIMGRIVVSEFVTLDGVMEDPGGAEGFENGGWAFKFERGVEGDTYKLDEVMDAEVMLLGRVTYEGFAAAWPEREDEAGFAAKMNGMPKYVVSKSLERADWANTTILSGDPVEEVAKLREAHAGNILIAGSATLVQTLIEHDLVDDLRLMVFPTVLGAGKRLFPAAGPKSFELVEAFPAGATTVMTLRRAEAEAPEAA